MARQNIGPRMRQLFGAEGGNLFFLVPLEIGAYILAATFFLRGSLVISGGTTNGTPVGENPGGLVQSIQLDTTTSGKPGFQGFRGGKLRNLTARSILRRRIFDRGWYQPDTYQTTGLTGAAGTFSLNSAFPVRFALPRLRRQFDTSFCCDAYSFAQFTLLTGSKGLCNPTTDRVWNEAGLYFDYMDDRTYPAGQQKVAELYDDDRPFIIQAANKRTAFAGVLPQGEAYLDALLISQSTASNTLVDTVVNRVTWNSGTAQIFDQEGDHIKVEQGRYVNDASQSMTGLYYTPIDRDGMLGSAQYGMNGVFDLSNPGGAGLDNLIVATRRVAPGSQGVSA